MVEVYYHDSSDRLMLFVHDFVSCTGSEKLSTRDYSPRSIVLQHAYCFLFSVKKSKQILHRVFILINFSEAGQKNNIKYYYIFFTSFIHVSFRPKIWFNFFSNLIDFYFLPQRGRLWERGRDRCKRFISLRIDDPWK